jgi:catechol 2,3-dioxygenase-like lactoylglutathione lyase family enzyme
MSYVALATDSFEEMARFYGHVLLFPVIAEWDRPTARGRCFNLGGGLRLEILDNARQKQPAELFTPGGRTHIVIEVADIEAARADILLDAPAARANSWGARLFQIRDPDGITITYLQWTADPRVNSANHTLDPTHGLTSGTNTATI